MKNRERKQNNVLQVETNSQKAYQNFKDIKDQAKTGWDSFNALDDLNQNLNKLEKKMQAFKFALKEVKDIS